ncbi:cytochrome c oxidase subunit I+III [Stella humosa]|uniref:cytochrome-c oxidase n=1 Tax=Stella humosa TaxID=94 RepID=A0A3N1LJJ8_9PROT|nr:cytochrome c oxidase subunit I [Stella humosa]ROP90596.1 cytochrome c oxidase subunit I+III [Stella humosa]BBK29508.1 cytochrome ubiquinol oxidase subunit I [Stella humosa]
MTAPSRDDALAPAPGLDGALEALWGTPRGWGRLAAVNHTIIGRRFIVTAFVFFAIGGLLAMLIRAQLATPGNAFLDPGAYNQIFTMHGTVMMFLFAIPMFEGLAVYLLPKMLGARDLAFPRLGAYGYWCYLFGGTLVVSALVMGVAPDSGWFMYTPLSSRPYSPGINADIWLIGITFVEVSAIAAAVEIVVSVLRVRTAGMALHRMPIFAWYLLVTAGMMLVGFPPLILGSILLELERAFGWPFFDPVRGGDPLLWQHLFWLFGHPEVYIIFLPAAGVVSTVLPVFARHRLVGYNWIVVSIVAMAFLSFGLWVHHMFAVGIPHLALGFFSAASMLVAIPTAVQIFAWIGTLLRGRPVFRLPMLFICGFFFIFVAGGLTGVMLAVVPFDWQVHDTHFVVAHLHYVLIGGFIFPMMAGAYYWLPHFTGRMPVHHLGTASFWLVFVGFNLTFLPMHLTGLLGMPRRVYTYAPGLGWDGLNLLSSVASFVMAIGFALFVVDILLQRRFGRPASADPWGAGTLEWAMPLPPPSYNFASQPALGEAAQPGQALAGPALAASMAAGEQHLGITRNGWRETLGVDAVTGRPDQVLLLPGPTFLPLWAAVATGVFFVSALFKLYLLALAGAAAVLVLVILWLWSMGSRHDMPIVPIGLGQSVPSAPADRRSPLRGALVFTLVADASFFASLAFGQAFLWVIAPNWPPPAFMAPAPILAGLAAGGLGAAAVAARIAIGARRPQPWLAVSAAGAALALAALAATIGLRLPPPATHAYAAAATALAAYAAFHAALALVAAGYSWARCRAGYVSPSRDLALHNTGLLAGYAGATGLVVLAMLHGLPLLAAP